MLIDFSVNFLACLDLSVMPLIYRTFVFKKGKMLFHKIPQMLILMRIAIKKFHGFLALFIIS